VRTEDDSLSETKDNRPLGGQEQQMIRILFISIGILICAHSEETDCVMLDVHPRRVVASRCK